MSLGEVTTGNKAELMARLPEVDPDCFWYQESSMNAVGKGDSPRKNDHQ